MAKNNGNKFGLIKFKVTKKSTVKSIGLVSEDCSEDDVKERENESQFAPFGGLLNSSNIKFGIPDEESDDEK